MIQHCCTCHLPIDFRNLSLEQMIVDDRDFCRRCFDEILESQDDLNVDYSKYKF
jgi:hypothetical protein